MQQTQALRELDRTAEEDGAGPLSADQQEFLAQVHKGAHERLRADPAMT